MSLEINITKLFIESTPKDYSASVTEIGIDAGPRTWNAALADSIEYPHVTLDNQPHFIAYFAGFGAWEEAELQAMPLSELNALFIQMVASSIREAGLNQGQPDWDKYQRDCEGGQLSGDLFIGTDGQIYFSLSD